MRWARTSGLDGATLQSLPLPLSSADLDEQVVQLRVGDVDGVPLGAHKICRGDGLLHLGCPKKRFAKAGLLGVAGLDGPVPVVLDIQISKFHALTEKARYTTGGRHGIIFDMAVTHAETGALLLPVRSVRADLNAFGGQQALMAIAHGKTQKIRITEHLAAVIRRELTQPEGYENASAGFVQMLYSF